jgi:hypothetical protein
MKKREYYGLEMALKVDVNNNIIPQERLDWRRVISWNPFENLFATYEEAERKKLWKEEMCNDFYYRVVKLD